MRLRAAFQIAVEDGWIRNNPVSFSLSSVIRNDLKTRTALTEGQEKALLSFLRFDRQYKCYYDEILILLKTGLRISEFCGLTVSDLDFENRLINIDHQLRWEAGSGFYADTPKSRSSIRKVPMSEETYQALQRVLARRGEPEPYTVDGYSGFVFVRETGVPYSAHHYQDALRQIVKVYNQTYDEKLPHITPHMLRHTLCTRLVSKNMNPKNVQYVMGHANVNLTMNLYAHTSVDDAKAEMVNLIS